MENNYTFVNKRSFILKELACLTVFILFSTVMAIIMVTAGFICQYKKNSEIKNTTYECGVSSFGDARIKYDIRYFNYAIAFLVFDIETIFLYPFAAAINNLGLFAVIETFFFVGILLFGLFFSVKKKLLRWI